MTDYSTLDVPPTPSSSLDNPQCPTGRSRELTRFVVVGLGGLALFAVAHAGRSTGQPMMMALSASSETAYCLLNALTGQYNCSLSPWDDDSIASDPYLINLQADDNSFYSPHNVTCSDWDDDTVYDEESCEGFDSGACQGSFDGPSITWPTDETYQGCTNESTGCYDWCGTACDDGWWSWCLWDVVAHAPELCAGNYTSKGPEAGDDGRRILRTATGRTCGIHSYCSPCGDDNHYCKSMWDKYFVWRDSMCANKQVAAALQPASLELWCEHWGLPYTPVKRR